MHEEPSRFLIIMSISRYPLQFEAYLVALLLYSFGYPTKPRGDPQTSFDTQLRCVGSLAKGSL